MSYGLIDYNTLKNISNAIRSKANSNTNYYPRDMASAINSLRSGGGFERPIIPSLSSYKFNNYDNNLMNFIQVIGFEFTNQLPTNENYYTVLGVESWPGISPSDVTVYSYVGEKEFLLCADSTFAGYTNNYLSNNYTNNPIYINGVLTSPNLGDVVCQNGGYFWRWTNNVYNSGNYVNGWRNIGVNISSTMGPPHEANGNLYFNRTGPIYGFGYSNQFNNNECSIIDMSQLFPYGLNNYSGPAFSGRHTRYMVNTYASTNVTASACGPNVTNMMNCYYYCQNIAGTSSCGNNVKDLSNCYYYCGGLTTAVIGPNVTNGQGAYVGCANILSVIGNPNSLVNGYNMFGYCTNLSTIPNSFPSLVNGSNMFYSDYYLSILPNCPNLVNGAYMFMYINTLTQNQIQDFLNTAVSLKDMTSMFNFGEAPQYVNLMNLNFPNTVISINNLFSGYSIYNVNEQVDPINNIWANVEYDWVTGNAVCPDTVYYTVNAYGYKSNLTKAAVGNNVVNMAYMYQNCNGLTDAVSGPNVMIMDYSYANCFNLVNAACGPKMLTMYNTFYNCRNLINAVCGDNVLIMNSTYQNCINLVDAVCGPNVTDMISTYSNCYNLVNATCGDKVHNFNGTYRFCNKLTNAICGNNVYYMEYTYANCSSLTEAICGDNVWVMNGTYQSCTNLINAACGPNVRIMGSWVYQYCYNLINGVMSSNVLNSYFAYANLPNLRTAYMAGNYSNLRTDLPEHWINNASAPSYCVEYGTFSNCLNLENVILDHDLAGRLQWTFNNCSNIRNIPAIPEGVIGMNYMFNNCQNIESDVYIGNNVNMMTNAFGMCWKIQNIYIGGAALGLINSYSYVVNAFRRTTYTLRRNIVINNYEGWNKFVYWNGAGNFAKTNETYAEPIGVNVNGTEYSCVRCSYSTSYNCYIYCME